LESLFDTLRSDFVTKIRGRNGAKGNVTDSPGQEAEEIMESEDRKYCSEEEAAEFLKSLRQQQQQPPNDAEDQKWKRSAWMPRSAFQKGGTP
jgi:hypothetical protein